MPSLDVRLLTDSSRAVIEARFSIQATAADVHTIEARIVHLVGELAGGDSVKVLSELKQSAQLIEGRGYRGRRWSFHFRQVDFSRQLALALSQFDQFGAVH